MSDHDLPPPDPLAVQFQYADLPPLLKDISKPFADLGAYLTWVIPATPARTTCLRLLLAARDAAIAAKLEVPKPALREDDVPLPCSTHD